MNHLAVSLLGDKRCRLGPQRETERWHESGVPEARPRTLLLPVAEAQPVKFPGLKCVYSKQSGGSACFIPRCTVVGGGTGLCGLTDLDGSSCSYGGSWES